jgi:hypothetical protein
MPTRRYPRDTSDEEAAEEDRPCSPQRENTKMSANIAKPLTFRFIDDEANVRLELNNEADHALKCVEILTVFLRDLETGGPSQAHIRFDQVDSIRAKEHVVLSHKTWVNGKIAGAEADLLNRLKVVLGEAKPYVLDISWEDPEGKTRFQRIPVGH